MKDATHTLEQRLAAVEERLELVAKAQTHQHDEIVTHRLVVVDQEQNERCTIDGGAGAESIEFRLRSPNDHAGVLISSGDDGDDGLPTVALLDRDGTIGTSLDREDLWGVDKLRTQELVVVDPDGFERLTTLRGDDGRSFTLRIWCRDEKTFVELQANEESTAVDQVAGVYVTASDELVGQFEAFNREGEHLSAGEATLKIDRAGSYGDDRVEITSEGLRFPPQRGRRR